MRRFAAVFLMLVLVFSLSACCFQLGSKQAKYTASFTTYIHNRNLYSADSSITSGDLAASQRLTDTYAVIIKSNQVLNSVAEKLDSSLSAEQLRDMLEIAPIGETEVVKISVHADDSQLALDIAQTLVEILPSAVNNIMEGSSVKIVDNPTVTENSSLLQLFP